MYRYILILLFTSLTAYSQNTKRFQVVDKEYNPIPFSTIYDDANQQGLISDKNGFFEYAVGSNVLVSSVGYVQDYFDLKADKNILILSEEILNLNEVVVKAKDKLEGEVLYSGFSKRDKSHYNKFKSDNFKVAVKLSNPFNDSAKLEDLIMNVKINNSTYIRMRVMEIGQDNKPGRDLLRENVIIKDNNRFGDLTVDLSEYNIIIPAEGCFVGFELLPIEKDSDLLVKVGVTADSGDIVSYRGPTFQDTWSLYKSYVGKETNYMIGATFIH